MAFCSGGDLSIYIKKRGRLSTLDYYPYDGAKEKVFWPHPKEGGLDGRVARCFLGQLAEALLFLRARNLIHRDIKPQVSQCLPVSSLIAISPVRNEANLNHLCTESAPSPSERTRLRQWSSSRNSSPQSRRLWFRSNPSSFDSSRDIVWLSSLHGSRDSPL